MVEVHKIPSQRVIKWDPTPIDVARQLIGPWLKDHKEFLWLPLMIRGRLLQPWQLLWMIIFFAISSAVSRKN